jgi:hypothetical protein
MPLLIWNARLKIGWNVAITGSSTPLSKMANCYNLTVSLPCIIANQALITKLDFIHSKGNTRSRSATQQQN